MSLRRALLRPQSRSGPCLPPNRRCGFSQIPKTGRNRPAPARKEQPYGEYQLRGSYQLSLARGDFFPFQDSRRKCQRYDMRSRTC